MPGIPVRLSLRWRLPLLAVGLILAVVAAILTAAYLQIESTLVRVGSDRAQVAADQLATLLAQPAQQRLKEVQHVADAGAVWAYLSDPTPEYAAAALAELRTLGTNARQLLEIWDADGHRRLFTASPPEAEAEFPTAVPLPIPGNGPLQLIEGRIFSQVAGTIPVTPGAQNGSHGVAGYVVVRRASAAAPNSDALARLVGAGASISVGNQDRSVWTDLSKAVPAPLIDMSRASVVEYGGGDGRRYLGATRPIAGTPWAILVSFSKGIVVAPAIAFTKRLGLIGMFFLLLSIALTVIVSRSITTPVVDLTAAAEEIAAGDYARRALVTRGDEIGRLGDAFNQMTAQVEHTYARLETQTRQLHDRERDFRSMFADSPQPGWVCDREQLRFLEVNDAAIRHYGYARDEFLAMTFADLRDVAVDEPLAIAVDQNAAIERHRLKSGAIIDVEVAAHELTFEGRPAIKYVANDVTARRRAEREAELSHLHSLRLEAQNRRVQEASRLKSEFLANMSHELRTPLNSIIGFAQLLHDGEVPADAVEFKEFLSDILSSGQHLLQLINDVLDLSKVEAGRLEFNPEEVDLEETIGEVLGLLRTTIAARQQRIESVVDPAVAEAFVDRSRLKQVLYNYLSNAIKFTPDFGRIVVRVSPEGDDAFRLDVQDSGIGIAADDIVRLFVEFQQLEAGAAKRHQGTGLGLALTKRLVEAQGGSVAVQSTPAVGSTFSAILPRHAPGGTALRSPRSFPGAHIGAPRVLVIEDNPRDQDVLVDALLAAGYAVETATNGAQALAQIKANAFDAITLDLILPDASGFDLLRHIRASERNDQVPVIVITVAAANGVFGAFAVQDVLAKPAAPEELIAALKRLGVPATRQGSILVVDDDQTCLRLMGVALGQLGYDCKAVADAAEALRLAEHDPPLAVVLDLVMPGMDGFAFLSHFRRLPPCQRIPVIVWTVKDLSSRDIERLRTSVQGVMRKGHSGGTTVVEELLAFVMPRVAA